MNAPPRLAFLVVVVVVVGIFRTHCPVHASEIHLSGDRRRQMVLPQVLPKCDPRYTALTPTHTMCLLDNPNGTVIPISQQLKDEIVDLHNELRLNVTPPATNMQKMVWDDKLAMAAEKWAMQCSEDHDSNQARLEPDYPGVYVGQNIAMGHTSFRIAINQWYFSEVDMYTYGEAYVHGMGHYYQVVTHDANRIGCGQARCPHSRYRVFRVCNYVNRLDASRPPYNNGTWCSLCPNHCDNATKKLCDCNAKVCYNGGTLDVTTCECRCDEHIWTGNLCEKNICNQRDYFNFCARAKLSDCDHRFSASTCPVRCGLCPVQCGGKVCQNEGELDVNNCTCRCKGRLTGDTCEECQAADEEHCPSQSTAFCGYSSTYRTDCPHRCGLCPEGTGPCGGKRCKHHGQLNGDTCTCSCLGGYTGEFCEICPEKDEVVCVNTGVDRCTAYPHWALFMENRCPYKCGYCP